MPTARVTHHTPDGYLPTGGGARTDTTIKEGFAAPTSRPWSGNRVVAHFRDLSLMRFLQPNVPGCITSEKFSLGNDICRLLRFHKELIAHPLVDVFTPTAPHPPCSDAEYIKQIPLAGRQVIAVFEASAPKLLAEYPHHSFHPVLHAIASTLTGFERDHGWQVLAPDVNGSYAASIRDALTQLQALRTALLQPTMPEHVKGFERTYRNRRQAVCDYLNGVLPACSKITHVHIILGGLDKAGTDFTPKLKQTLRTSPFDRQAIAFAHRKTRFLSALNKQYGKSLLGYIWRLDHCPNLGLQMSFMLAFNGHKHPDQGALAKGLGRLWLASGLPRDSSHWGQRVHPLTEVLEQDHLTITITSKWADICSRIADRFCLADRYFKLQLPEGMNGFRKHINVKPPRTCNLGEP